MPDHPPAADRHDILEQYLDTSHGGVGKEGATQQNALVAEETQQ